MTTIRGAVGAITLFVADPQRARAFYVRVFDAPVVHEDEESVAVRMPNVILNLLVERAAPEVIAPATVGSGTRALLTIEVEDVDRVCAQLRDGGVELLNGPVDRPWGVRTAAFADPDGHVWELAAPRS